VNFRAGKFAFGSDAAKANDCPGESVDCTEGPAGSGSCEYVVVVIVISPSITTIAAPFGTVTTAFADDEADDAPVRAPTGVAGGGGA
jgi:hypothetical protein